MIAEQPTAAAGRRHRRKASAGTDRSRRTGIRRIAVVTPVFEDWACLRALVGEIAECFTGTDLEFSICAVDDGSSVPADPTVLALPPGSCVVEIEIVHLALNLSHQRAIAVGLSTLAGRSHRPIIPIFDAARFIAQIEPVAASPRTAESVVPISAVGPGRALPTLHRRVD